MNVEFVTAPGNTSHPRPPSNSRADENALDPMNQSIIRKSDHRAAAGPEQSGHLREDRFGIRDVFEHLGADDLVKSSIRKAKLVQLALQEPDSVSH